MTAERGNKQLSIVIPAKNEAESLAELLPQITQSLPGAEVIVVNDGSSDDTVSVCAEHGITVVTHPYSMGNGAAIKSGARASNGDILVFMDADGQHRPQDIPILLQGIDEGYDMVIGVRKRIAHANSFRFLANTLYNRMASWMVNRRIYDLTSGFRAVRANKFKAFLYLLPNGFSYPTTITMAFFRSGYAVDQRDVDVQQRIGKSHISPFKDGIRFLLIIFKVGSLYSPLKIFFPVSAFFLFSGIGLYLYTYFVQHRFTNMGTLLLLSAIIIFLVGIVSEQITALSYQKVDDAQDKN